MSLIASRRLHVRDDGAGDSQAADVSFAEFESEDAIVLLGDPGMGKTTLFRQLAGSNYQTVRTFLIDPNRREPVFLDALDEYRAKLNNRGAADAVAEKLIALKRPRFRLSCRIADWFGAIDQDILRLASPSRRVVVLEIRPLSRDKIAEIAEEIVSDPWTFIAEAEEAGLYGLLGNPQSLHLFAKAWSSGKKPRNKFEAFDLGINELASERNPSHKEVGAQYIDPERIIESSGAAAVTILLSNAVGVSSADADEAGGFVGFSDIPCEDHLGIEAALKRRLFTSLDVGNFELMHRTVAEYLAARDLSKRINGGLPISRVMALMCGLDGVPVSSLRGLHAWFMCHLGVPAELYVSRDPYGIATYGDASVLVPGAQCAIWRALRDLSDPWFIATEGDRGSFQNLANEHTIPILLEILRDTTASLHLKITVLEAIANSKPIRSLRPLLETIVLNKDEAFWLRATAIQAFIRNVDGNYADLNSLDFTLNGATDDAMAAELRVEILEKTATQGDLPRRILSVLAQAAIAEEGDGTFGRLYPLLSLPSGEQLDVVLDGGSGVLTTKDDDDLDRREIRSLFHQWFERRLEVDPPPSAAQLCKWLATLRLDHHHEMQNANDALKALFERQSGLFDAVFDRLADIIPAENRSFWVFIAHDLWSLLPAATWPAPRLEFFLSRAADESDPSRASDYFQMFLSLFPSDGGSLTTAEDAFCLVATRTELRDALGDWTQVEIPQWRLKQSKRAEEKTQAKLAATENNVAYLIPRLSLIESGLDRKSLAWGASKYFGFANYETGLNPKARLTCETNDEIANAMIAGFIRYLDSSEVSSLDEVIGWWENNRFPHAYSLLCLSVFLRCCEDLQVPDRALPQTIAAVAIEVFSNDRIPNFKETLNAWLIGQTKLNADVVAAILRDLWTKAVNRKGPIILPGFYELRNDEASQGFLAGVSADVLSNGVISDPNTLRMLVGILLKHGQLRLVEIGKRELLRANLTVSIRVIWTTGLFVIGAAEFKFEESTSETESALWEAIELIGRGFPEWSDIVVLAPKQRVALVQTIGRQFENQEHPPGAVWGSRNPWQAAEFVKYQIKRLATDESVEAALALGVLEENSDIESYREFIRHYRAQRARRERDVGFLFASAKSVAGALRNQAPANSADLLAFVVDHLDLLNVEIRNSSTERYRAYWNHEGRRLKSPKYEEVCSGLLADDLQRRISHRGLIVTVEHHLVSDKECDLMVLQGHERLLPIEAKHHFHRDLWTAWQTQLDRLYTRDPKAGGLGIYLVFWSGNSKARRVPKPLKGAATPSSAIALHDTLVSCIPSNDRNRLRVVVVDITPPDDHKS